MSWILRCIMLWELFNYYCVQVHEDIPSEVMVTWISSIVGGIQSCIGGTKMPTQKPHETTKSRGELSKSKQTERTQARLGTS
jgi:hypothetical protein